MDNLIKILVNRLDTDKDLKVRFLLLDPLTSPSVFRSFLETHSEQVSDTLNENRDIRERVEDPYFTHKTYADFDGSYKSLERNKKMQKYVRYYAHNPSCWMVIADTEAYYQPYTLGMSEDDRKQNSKDLCLGLHMPVLKFCGKSSKNELAPDNESQEGRPYEVVRDHFIKLWNTTDVDFYQMHNRVSDKQKIVRNIFKKRKQWLRLVAEFAWKSNFDFRNYTRQPCRSKDPVKVKLEEKDKDEKTINVFKNLVLANYSKIGIGFEIVGTLDLKLESKFNVIAMSGHSNPDATASRIHFDLFGENGKMYTLRTNEVFEEEDPQKNKNIIKSIIGLELLNIN